MDVGEFDKVLVVYVLVDETCRTIAHRKMSSTSVSAAERPGVHALSRVSVPPTGVYVPLVSCATYVIDIGVTVGDDTSVAACMRTDKPPWTVVG